MIEQRKAEISEINVNLNLFNTQKDNLNNVFTSNDDDND